MAASSGPEYGWNDALETYRPFLSYNELGSMLDEGPSRLYDALSAILGLDALVDAQAVLQKARTSRDKAHKDAKAMREKLLATLAPLEDERAQAVAIALGANDWGLDRIEQILAGSATEAGEDSVLRLLRELTATPAPTTEALAKAAQDLRTAAANARSARSGSRGVRSRPRSTSISSS